LWLLAAAGAALPFVLAQSGASLERQALGTLPGCVLAAIIGWRLERRFYLKQSGGSLAARLKGAFGVLSAGLLLTAGTAAALLLLGPRSPQVLGLAPVLATCAFFFVSAAAGSALTVSSAVAASAVVRRFRARLVLAIAPLLCVAMALAASFAIWVHGRSVALLEALEKAPISAAHGEDLHLFEWAVRSLRAVDGEAALAVIRRRPGTSEAALFLLAALGVLPFLLSALSKLADEVMERLEPLAMAFDAVADGRRHVQVEVGGSEEFRRLGEHFNRMVGVLGQAERLERAYGLYVSRPVAERIRAQHGEGLLPVSLREASVLFADIRGFTQLSERRSPEVVVDVLNRYFDRVVSLVNAHQGYLNKFIGDAVVVVFNGPIDQPDHAARAVKFGIALQEMVAEMNRGGAFPEVAGGIGIGVGIATGPMVCGNIGGGGQFEYTVIGDTVNLSARLTARAGAGEVWINAEAARWLPEGIPAQPLEPIRVKGKTFAVVPYRVWPVSSDSRGGSAA
jgi:class 3 adenylate cyclase